MWIPDEIDKCHNDINIPCSFIDKSGHNQTGFYTQFDLIQLHPKKASRNQKRGTTKTTKKKCTNSVQQIFSVPSGSKKIVRIDDKIIIEDLFSISTPIDVFKFVWKHHNALYSFYKQFIQNNTDYMIARDFLFFLVMIVLIVLVFFLFFCLCTKRKCIIFDFSNDSAIKWEEINKRIQEECVRIDIKMLDQITKLAEEITKLEEKSPKTSMQNTKKDILKKDRSSGNEEPKKRGDMPNNGEEFQLNKDSITLDMIKNGDIDLNLMKQYAKTYIPTKISGSCGKEKYKLHIIKHFETTDV